MDSLDQKKVGKRTGFLDRFGRSSFPPAAVLGAFVSFFTTAFKPRPAPRKEPAQSAALVQIGFAQPQRAPVSTHLEIEYSKTLVLGAANSAHPFRRSISGIAVGPEDRIFVLGDEEVRIFEPDGRMFECWKAPEGALCLTVGSDGRVYFGLPGGVAICSSAGAHAGGFAVGESGSPAQITAIRISGRDILIADAAAKLIRRYDSSGKQIGVIGTQGKARGFMLPNRSLDIAVGADGMVRATDPGRHRVSVWSSNGEPLGYFGKFGLVHPEDFVGCCNPVNLAIAPGGNIVTAEKVASRVKVYSPEGRLLALIGPENFDPKCIHLHLAVDSKGRILVADPVRLEAKIFSPSIRPGVSKNV